jgi:PKHD-type hydroxylase
MQLVLPEVLTADALAQVRTLLASAGAGAGADEGWTDGTATSGTQSRGVKTNEQMPEQGRVTAQAREIVVAHLSRHPLFMMAALPRRLYPPNFNRYRAPSSEFGNHIDNALRNVPGSTGYLRTDLSCTIFLSDPQSYEGGELVITQAGSETTISGIASSHKLQAGDAVLYPASTVHRVNPVTRGERIACFFWVESMVRNSEQRQMLYEMDLHIMRLRQRHGESAETVGLTAAYHNLLRMWAQT